MIAFYMAPAPTFEIWHQISVLVKEKLNNHRWIPCDYIHAESERIWKGTASPLTHTVFSDEEMIMIDTYLRLELRLVFNVVRVPSADWAFLGREAVKSGVLVVCPLVGRDSECESLLERELETRETVVLSAFK